MIRTVVPAACSSCSRPSSRHQLPGLFILLHAFSASSEPAIGEVVRERFGRVYHEVRDLTGATPAQAREFLGTGMMLTGIAAMDRRPTGTPVFRWTDELVATLHSPED